MLMARAINIVHSAVIAISGGEILDLIKSRA